MKTIFDEAARNELSKRIETINEKSTALWGTMNVYQMLKHCTNWEEWIQGTHKPVYKQALIGYLFGKMGLRNMIKDETPFKQNLPTTTQFKNMEKQGDLEADKNKWIALIKTYNNYSNPEFIHDFFGKMTKEQIGILVYKHNDHHLRQFGA